MEIWRDVKGFEGLYQVSTKGHVRSLNYKWTGQTKLLKPQIHHKGSGILGIWLYKNGKKHEKSLARLVVETFTTLKLKNTDLVMNKDNNKMNCSLKNLYVITRNKRTEMTYDEGKMPSRKHDYYGKELTVRQIAKINRINPRTIRRRMHKLRWNIYESAEIPLGTNGQKRKGGKIKYETRF